MTIHHYTDSTPPAKDATYTLGTANLPCACRGLGLHPTHLPEGWHQAAERPKPPQPTGYRWADADPAWALVDGVSVPQGAWEPIPHPEPDPLDERRAELVAEVAYIMGQVVRVGAHIPADWTEARAFLRAIKDKLAMAGDIPALIELGFAIDELTTLRIEMDQLGLEWSEVVAAL